MDEALFGHAADHGRVFQQGQGQQFNVDHAYFGGEGPTLPWLPDPSSVPLVREWDPLELGVHRASMASGNAVPPYVSRDIDDDLLDHFRRASNRGGLILIIGDSTAGKSRAAYETAQRAIPDYRLFAPDSSLELREALPNLVTARERCAIWLEDFERYLGPDGLTSSIVTQLRFARIVVIATLRTEQYRRLTSGTDRSADDEHYHNTTAAEHVLNLADQVVLQRKWSSSEIGRARSVHDVRVLDALLHGDDFGIAEYLAAGPKLYKEWQLAWDGINPRGAALVSAAVDCVRAGLTDAVPLSLIRAIHEHYLDRAGGRILRPESFEAAIAWAERRRYGVTSLLVPAKIANAYRVFDYLPDEVSRSAPGLAIPDTVWNEICRHFETHEAVLTSVATAAASQDRPDVAESILKNLADAGSAQASLSLGNLFARLGRTEDAAERFRSAAEADSREAMTQLGIALERERNLVDAELWLTKASRLGDSHALVHLAQIAVDKGHVGRAEKLLREAVKNKEEGSHGLGTLLANTGRLAEAESWLKRSAESGSYPSALGLGVLLADSDRPLEAERIWLDVASQDSDRDAKDLAVRNLALLYSKLGRNEEADQWHRRAVETGTEDAALNFAAFLSRMGHGSEAESLLEELALAGDGEAAYRLGWILGDTDRHEVAETWLRQAVEHGFYRAAGPLAASLEELGRNEDAKAFWRLASEHGDGAATYVLYRDRHIEYGTDETTRQLLDLAADQGSAMAQCDKGRAAWDSGDTDVGRGLLKKSFKSGHAHAYCMLGRRLRDSGDFRGAEECFRAAFLSGHEHSAEDLSRVLARLGRGREAASWLRRWNGISSSKRIPKQRKARKGASKRKRPKR